MQSSQFGSSSRPKSTQEPNGEISLRQLDTPNPATKLTPMRIKHLPQIALALLFLASCGGPKPMDPKAPESPGGLSRQVMLTGAEAKAKIDEFHMRKGTPDDCWAAAYGAGERFWIFAARFPTPEDALNAVNSMSRAAPMRGRYTAPISKSIAYQAGLQMLDKETNASIFFFARDSWAVACWLTIPSDMEIAVGSVEWVPAAGS